MAGLVKLSRLLLAVGLLAVAGCAPGAGVGGPTAVDGPAKSVTTPQREDKSFAKVVQAAGFDAGTAAFAVLTTSTVEVANGHTFIVRQDFPNGATAATAIHLFSGGGGTPGQPPRVKLVALSETAISYTFSYAIVTKDLPDDLRAQVLAGLPGGAPAQAERDGAVAAFVAPAAGLGVPAQSEPSTINVVVDGVVSQTVESGIDKALETAGLDETNAGTSWDVYKAGKKVWDAIDANQMITDALARLKAARKCAENPTNELTRKQYEEDPGAKEELLRQLDEIASDVTTSAVATFVGLLTDTAGGLVKSAPWLGFITGPAVNYIKQTLASVIEDRVKAAEKLVPKCTRYRVTGDGDSLLGVEPAIINGFTTPFSVQGSTDKLLMSWAFTPSDATGRAGTVRLVGSGKGGGSVRGKGNYTITETDTGRFELTWWERDCFSPLPPGMDPCRNIGHKWKITPFTAT